MSELKPCPFCGTHPKAEPASRSYVILCANDPGCAVLPAVAGDTLELAARKWNYRADAALALHMGAPPWEQAAGWSEQSPLSRISVS